MLRFLRPRSQLARTLFTQTPSTSAKALTADKLNPRLLEAQYAVRGELVLKSMEYQKDLESGNSTLPFKSIIACNIGNPQEVGQSPISFPRQVLALCTCPELLNNSAVTRIKVDIIIKQVATAKIVGLSCSLSPTHI